MSAPATSMGLQGSRIPTAPGLRRTAAWLTILFYPTVLPLILPVHAQDARPASRDDWEFLGRAIDKLAPPEPKKKEVKTTGKAKKAAGGSEVHEPLLIRLDYPGRYFERQFIFGEATLGADPSGPVALAAPAAPPPEASGAGLNLSRDGNTIVGYLDNGFFTPFHAFTRTEAAGFVDLGTLDPANNATLLSFATDVSDDGSVVVGYSALDGSNSKEHAFRRTEGAGMVDLGTGIGAEGFSRAYGVSGDGSVVVGRSDFPPPQGSFFNVRQPFRWTQAGGLQSLGGLEATSRGAARAVTADGAVIVGESRVTVTENNVTTGRDRAFRWTEGGGMQELGVLPGHHSSVAVAVSDDGSIVVGISSGTIFGEEAGGVINYDLNNSRAFYWTVPGGILDLTQLLADAGVDLGGRVLVGVRGMSPDGAWISAETARPSAETPEFITEAIPVLVSLSETLPPPSRLLNLSTRGQTLTGDGLLIPGFVVRGDAPKQVLVRAAGPELAAFGVAGPLADPVLELKQGDTTLFANDDWGSNPNAAEIATVSASAGAFPLTAGSASAALLVTLAPGTYTAPVTGKGATTGTLIVEVYEIAAGGPRLVNISTRGPVGTGDAIMIAGFVVSTESSGRFLVRAVGPTLSSFGVQGVLANPQLRIFRQEPDGSSTEIFANDDWGSPSSAPGVVYAAQDAGAFPLGGGSKDAAIVVQLMPGAYTVQVSGVGGGTGSALAEVYELP